jgi:hypothetical protein
MRSGFRLWFSLGKISHFVRDDSCLSVVIPSGRLCENSVHGSTKLTTNAVVSLKIEYLSVRPEQRRRAPREFSHSLAERGIFSLCSAYGGLKMNHYPASV